MIMKGERFVPRKSNSLFKNEWSNKGSTISLGAWCTDALPSASYNSTSWQQAHAHLPHGLPCTGRHYMRNTFTSSWLLNGWSSNVLPLARWTEKHMYEREPWPFGCEERTISEHHLLDLHSASSKSFRYSNYEIATLPIASRPASKVNEIESQLLRAKHLKKIAPPALGL